MADIRGGEIVRDAGGRPTGIFKDNAMALIDRAVPSVSMRAQIDATFAAMDYLAARGVTGVHHMGTWQHVDVFRAARQRGPFKNEAGLTGAVRSALTGLLDALGPLAQPLWVRTA